MKFRTTPLSSLTKVFADQELEASPLLCGTALQGEVYSFQVAFTSEVRLDLSLTLTSELETCTTLRLVKLTPAEYLASQFDDNVLRSKAGLFPDLLQPLDGTFQAMPNQWHAVWVTVRIPEDQAAGQYGLTFTFSLELPGHVHDPFTHTEKFELEILPAKLPPQRLLHTEWFHTDCIMSLYETEAWSERHWDLVETYMRNAVEHGVNMILTPIFTPPLDTEVGGERPTVQLVGMEYDNGSWRFDFSRLDRWFDVADRCGVTYFEFAHFFTQWGAEFTPKIVVKRDGVEEKMFGWHVRADSSKYADFLAAFIPELLTVIEERGIKDKCFFHVSDEPKLEQLEPYRKAATLLRKHLESCNIMDALSNVDFYKDGLTDIPVPSIQRLDDFASEDLSVRWCYYCGKPEVRATNRFLHFPGARTRIFGLQMYKYDIGGFLHWGYNFWYSRFSKGKIDPFHDPSAGNGFPAGDAFVVYPGENGPLDSIRWELINEALQDLRALQLLESLIGRERTIAALEDDCEPITLTQYPVDYQWLLNKREQINRLIAEQGIRGA